MTPEMTVHSPTNFTTERHHAIRKHHEENERTAALRSVKASFVWLAGRPGYRSVLSCPMPTASISATPSRPASPMPSATDTEIRDKAAFALFGMTCIRDGAAASLRLKRVDLEEGHIFRDGRDARAKNGKTINTRFYPVDAIYRGCFWNRVRYLRTEKLFENPDALFPEITSSANH